MRVCLKILFGGRREVMNRVWEVTLMGIWVDNGHRHGHGNGYGRNDTRYCAGVRAMGIGSHTILYDTV